LISGRIAHQVIDHVHFHVRSIVYRAQAQIIPKPDQEQGLGVGWPAKEANMGELKSLLEEIKQKL
jgi:diadenosine tetraphosphate (Ap4A) HIT family hydrolase